MSFVVICAKGLDSFNICGDNNFLVVASVASGDAFLGWYDSGILLTHLTNSLGS
jgi:hypothetical protein